MEYQCLTNGFQVIYEKPPCSIPITSIYVVCKISAIHEPAHLKGISHLIEHMSFKGTTTTPNTEKFLEQFNVLGIEYDASTFHECVRFEIKCQDEHVEKGIKLLSESILSCDFSFKNFKKEENVVDEENRKNDDNPEYIVAIATNELVFEDTQFQLPVDHSKYHTTKLNYKEAYNYYKKTYIPSNLFLSITTNINFKKIMDFIKKTKFAKGVLEPRIPMKYIPQRDGFDYQIIHKKLKTNRWEAQDQKNYQYQPLQWKRVKIKQEKN
jgi:predicted Zn-dependent peptidase